MRIGASFPAAFVAGIAIVLITGPLMRLDRQWIAESVISSLAAAAWMFAGITVAGRDGPKVAPVLLCVGSAVAWYFARGIVHSHSAYYGLFPFGTACVSAMTAWAIAVRHEPKTWRASAIVIPMIVLGGGWSVALANPQTGFETPVTASDLVIRELPVALASGARSEVYIWSSPSVNLMARSDSIRIEIDRGSGSAPFRVVELRDANAVRQACAAFAAGARDVAKQEIEDGPTPAFITRLPIRWSHCPRQRLWIARP